MTRDWTKFATLGAWLLSGVLVLPAAAGAQPWNGLYVGAHAGHVWSDVDGVYDNNDTDGPTLLNVLDFEGELVGGHLGYNIQNGQLVFGVEGDLSGSNVEDTTLSPETPPRGPDPVTADLGRLGSIRGRLGLAAGGNHNLLFYVTGGYGFGEFNISAINVNNGTRGRLNFDEEGAVYGAGLEWAKGDGRLRFRIEYLHYDVGTNSSLFVPPFTNNTDVDPGDSVSFDDVDVVRVGLSFKLGHYSRPPVPYK